MSRQSSSKNQQLNRALLDAAIADDFDQVRHLLDAGADMEARDEEHDETPLMLAADARIVELLLGRGADAKAHDRYRRTTILSTIGTRPNREKLQLLLAAGADPETRDVEGETVLHRLVATGDVEIVRLLCESGADPNIADAEGNTPLIVAVKMAHIILIQVLLQAGGSANFQNIYGHSALSIARSGDSTLIRQVIEASCEVGATPIKVL